ncbi:MAG TPA: phosphate signaling complex protein PhoU [Acetobacteraceae bacterium]|jgi:phosphate transport system protein|nr:phosphate signaling complex protein PhoU [Acetobacteraceae bacterium]
MSEPAEHIVKSYEQELTRLSDLIARMGGLVESEVALAAAAVVDQDVNAATRAVETDPQVDALEREVEQFSIRMLALRQPVASDLRRIVAALKITAGLERIGDYAVNAAKRSMVLSHIPLSFSLTPIASMARMVQENLKTVIDAASQNDPERAIEVWRSDRMIDDLYTAIFRELITYMMEDPRNITPCTHLLFIAKNLERIGDHATNIAETVHFAATGEVLPDERPKGVSSAFAIDRPEA